MIVISDYDPAWPKAYELIQSDLWQVLGDLALRIDRIHNLIWRGRFRFIGLPLRIRGGTGSPVQAIAVFEG